MSRTALLGLLLAALITAVAVAHPRIHVARQVAVTTWGNVCDGHVRIVKRHLGYRPDGREILGQARVADCLIELDDRPHWAWSELCWTVAHEYGHLAGRDHSPRKSALMYPVIHPFWRCGRDHNHPRLGSYGL